MFYQHIDQDPDGGVLGHIFDLFVRVLVMSGTIIHQFIYVLDVCTVSTSSFAA